jgi:penicillin-binding protein 2
MAQQSYENTNSLQKKLPIVLFVVFLFFSLIFWRLFQLQVQKGAGYAQLSNDISLREEEIPARRGDILDRNGMVLADSRPYLEILATPQYMNDRERVLTDVSEITGIPTEEMKEALQKARRQAPFEPVVIASGVSYESAARLKEHFLPEYEQNDLTYDLSGISVRVLSLRHYLYPELFSHALGYLKEVSEKELVRLQEDYPDLYSRQDIWGASGMERGYDQILKGVDGQVARVVDARGREVSDLPDTDLLKSIGTYDPVPGKTVKTSLHFESQEVTAKAFGDRKGSVVALDPHTGEVIVLYSSPGYDGNRILKKIDKKYWAKINLHEDKFLFNRAVQAMYPPASTYKTVMVTAAVEEGIVDPEKTHFHCGGGMRFGNRYFKCWRKGGHGRVNAVKAMAQSCDVYFYQVGLKLGVDKIAEYAKKFGFGEKTGIKIPYEKSGLVPTKEWKKKRYDQDWIESETLSVSIGQSYNLVTMMQNARMAAMIANGGSLVTPHLVNELIDASGTAEVFPKPEAVETSLQGSLGLKVAKEGMIAVVHGYGTATRLRQSPYKIAGKTGTAQVVSSHNKTRRTENHGLFIAFAPYDDPKIAVAVMVENGGGGSSAAAPIAHKLIDTYLSSLETDEEVTEEEEVN